MGNFSNNDNNEGYIVEPIPVKVTEEEVWDEPQNIQNNNVVNQKKKQPIDIRKMVKIAAIVIAVLYGINAVKGMIIINNLKNENKNTESQSEAENLENKTDDELGELLAQKVKEMEVEISETATSASEFTYTENQDGTLTINKYVGLAENVEIPGMIDGKKVCYIGRESFVDNVYLKKVILPDTILSIDYRAFANCAKLEEVVAGKNLAYVGEKVFEKCVTLKNFNCSGDINSIRTIENQAFFECANLQNVNITSNSYVKITIGKDVFKNCTSLKEVDITGERVQEIELKEGTFNGCKQLVSVPFTDKVVTLGRWVFGNCENLNNIQLPKVTSLPRETFVNCKSLNTFTISSTVQAIDSGAFMNCTSLEKVVFDEVSLNAEDQGRHIGDDAFKNTAIKEVEIPGGYTHVGNTAFADCSALYKFVWHSSNSNVLRQTMGKNVFASSLQLKEIYLSKTFESVGQWDTRVTSNFTVYAIEGSAGQAFATEKGYPWSEWTE